MKGNGKGMDIAKKLPIGIENFEEICTEGFYYIDKTGLKLKKVVVKICQKISM